MCQGRRDGGGSGGPGPGRQKMRGDKMEKITILLAVGGVHIGYLRGAFIGRGGAFRYSGPGRLKVSLATDVMH